MSRTKIVDAKIAMNSDETISQCEVESCATVEVSPRHEARGLKSEVMLSSGSKRTHTLNTALRETPRRYHWKLASKLSLAITTHRRIWKIRVWEARSRRAWRGSGNGRLRGFAEGTRQSSNVLHRPSQHSSVSLSLPPRQVRLCQMSATAKRTLYLDGI